MKSRKKSAFGLKVALDDLTDVQQRAYTLMLESDRHGMVEGMEYEVELTVLRIVTGEWDTDIGAELEELTGKHIRLEDPKGGQRRFPMLSSVDIAGGVMRCSYPPELISFMDNKRPTPGAAIRTAFRSEMTLPIATAPCPG
jgi:hypothetical protein